MRDALAGGEGELYDSGAGRGGDYGAGVAGDHRGEDSVG